MIPWWAIIIGIVVIVIVVLTVRGWVIVRRCRNVLGKETNKVMEPKIDEDIESGSGDSN